MVKIIEEKCVGCGVCANICPDGIEMINGIAKIKNEKADCLKEAADACPRNAIILDGKEESESKEEENMGFGQGQGMGRGTGQGRGMGRGGGRGQGRGLGLGPRDGSGRGNRGYCN